MARPIRPACSILITGASSGLGAALARAYAAPGQRLVLGARRDDPLARVADACRAQGADVETGIIDVGQRDAMAAWVTHADTRQPLDLVIANAGISGGTAGGTETEDHTRRMFTTNLDGVLNTVMPLIPRFQARKAGQIALMASLAGFRGFPGAPAYCASKAAVRVWGEGLRGLLAADGVGVSVICPGFVRTPMTAVNPFPMPFLMDPDPAAALIRRALAADRGRIAFPGPLVWVARLVAALPDPWADALTRRTPRKP
ncbi:SDR family NAD(P)-dependent oxidoreductase [Pararhodospirillum oryzae]|uniref:Short-chain dehydrogenase n=1 Tax=Pararhodospirillum oryzae TaxID=478448 RepID=A0A512H7L7_9PROT|nr:SDR family NAD(P)-dependent oxidoreductase [Pararhodospirillum oryzae]GEO81455.1 short-chain dehydrogenase [Pararhodospirillum oryzae]